MRNGDINQWPNVIDTEQVDASMGPEQDGCCQIIFDTTTITTVVFL
jgi:hypothetical protein